jgi:hypothetical protein
MGCIKYFGHASEPSGVPAVVRRRSGCRVNAAQPGVDAPHPSGEASGRIIGEKNAFRCELKKKADRT